MAIDLDHELHLTRHWSQDMQNEEVDLFSPNKGFSLGRGSYLASIELPLRIRICRRQGT